MIFWSTITSDFGILVKSNMNELLIILVGKQLSFITIVINKMSLVASEVWLPATLPYQWIEVCYFNTYSQYVL